MSRAVPDFGSNRTTAPCGTVVLYSSRVGSLRGLRSTARSAASACWAVAPAATLGTTGLPSDTVTVTGSPRSSLPPLGSDLMTVPAGILLSRAVTTFGVRWASRSDCSAAAWFWPATDGTVA